MKAAELMLREPFPEILQETLSRFLRVRYGGEWDVRWRERNAQVVRGAQRWTCNLQVNSIFCNSGEKADRFEVVRREFANTPVAWRRLPQRAYFAAAVNPWSSQLLAHASLDIQPSIPNAGNLLIVPGSHKIRILDVATRRVYCICKSRSSLHDFRAEIAARIQAQDAGVPVPRILEQLADDCIVEEYIVGTPLNRLSDTALQGRLFTAAESAVAPLYDRTVKHIATFSYLAALWEEAQLNIRRKPTLREFESDAERGFASLNSGCGRFGETHIETVAAHGDFQPGNILWADDGKLWVIDWEFASRRQRNYDRIVYRTRSRFWPGLSARIQKLLMHSGKQFSFAELRVFIAEEMVFRLAEVARSPVDLRPTAFAAAWNELTTTADFLRTHGTQ